MLERLPYKIDSLSTIVEQIRKLDYFKGESKY